MARSLGESSKHVLLESQKIEELKDLR